MVRQVDEQGFAVWFSRFQDQLGKRANSMRFALWMLLQRQGWYIVEVGCIRRANSWAKDGMSTVVLSDAARHFDLRFMTIDKNPQSIEVCRQVAGSHDDCKLVYVMDDSIRALGSIREQVDLLYLDSHTYDPDDPRPCQEQTLEECRALREYVSEVALVVFDDHALPGGGRGLLAQEYLHGLGMRKLFIGYQLVMGFV